MLKVERLYLNRSQNINRQPESDSESESASDTDPLNLRPRIKKPKPKPRAPRARSSDDPLDVVGQKDHPARRTSSRTPARPPPTSVKREKVMSSSSRQHSAKGASRDHDHYSQRGSGSASRSVGNTKRRRLSRDEDDGRVRDGSPRDQRREGRGQASITRLVLGTSPALNRHTQVKSEEEDVYLPSPRNRTNKRRIMSTDEEEEGEIPDRGEKEVLGKNRQDSEEEEQEEIEEKREDVGGPSLWDRIRGAPPKFRRERSNSPRRQSFSIPPPAYEAEAEPEFDIPRPPGGPGAYMVYPQPGADGPSADMSEGEEEEEEEEEMAEDGESRPDTPPLDVPPLPATLDSDKDENLPLEKPTNTVVSPRAAPQTSRSASPATPAAAADVPTEVQTPRPDTPPTEETLLAAEETSTETGTSRPETPPLPPISLAASPAQTRAELPGLAIEGAEPADGEVSEEEMKQVDVEDRPIMAVSASVSIDNEKAPAMREEETEKVDLEVYPIMALSASVAIDDEMAPAVREEENDAVPVVGEEESNSASDTKGKADTISADQRAEENDIASVVAAEENEEGDVSMEDSDITEKAENIGLEHASEIAASDAVVAEGEEKEEILVAEDTAMPIAIAESPQGGEGREASAVLNTSESASVSESPKLDIAASMAEDIEPDLVTENSQPDILAGIAQEVKISSETTVEPPAPVEGMDVDIETPSTEPLLPSTLSEKLKLRSPTLEPITISQLDSPITSLPTSPDEPQSPTNIVPSISVDLAHSNSTSRDESPPRPSPRRSPFEIVIPSSRNASMGTPSVSPAEKHVEVLESAPIVALVGDDEEEGEEEIDPEDKVDEIGEEEGEEETDRDGKDEGMVVDLDVAEDMGVEVTNKTSPTKSIGTAVESKTPTPITYPAGTQLTAKGIPKQKLGRKPGFKPDGWKIPGEKNAPRNIESKKEVVKEVFKPVTGKKGKVETLKSQARGRSDSTSTISDIGSTPKASGKSTTATEKQVIEATDDEDDDDIIYCSCGKASRSDGNDTLVGCDGCDQWFHAGCVNLTEEQIDLVDSFYCSNCEKSSGHKTTMKLVCKREECEKIFTAKKSKFCSRNCASRHAKIVLATLTNKKTHKQLAASLANYPSPPPEVRIIDHHSSNNPASHTSLIIQSLSTTDVLAQRIESAEILVSALEKRILILGKAIEQCDTLPPLNPQVDQNGKKRKTGGGDDRPCGWVEALIWEDDIVDNWESEMPLMKPKITVVENGEDVEMGDNGVVNGVTGEYCMNQRKRCDRHSGWQKNIPASLEMELSQAQEVLVGLKSERSNIVSSQEGKQAGKIAREHLHEILAVNMAKKFV